jgi:hypothetical protein
LPSVDPSPAGSSKGVDNGPVGRLSIVDSTASVEPKTGGTPASGGSAKVETAAKVESAAKIETAAKAETGAKAETIDAALKGLVGTWAGVARHGDGELSTVELKLDDHGWAELTLPAGDGKPATIKSPVKLQDKELKLNGPDSDLLLGKLVNVTDHQLVLERSGGQVTFVRQ